MTMRHTRLLFLASILLAATVGCGEAPDEPVWTQIDSAGVTIVFGPTPQHDIGVVASAPILEISDAAEVPLFRTSAVLPRPDGSFVVLDSGNHRILLFGADGTLRTTVGRQGDGPGEFQSPLLAVLYRDSTFVYDGRLRRVTVFGPELEFGRDQLLEGSEGTSPPRFVGVLDGGHWVGSAGQSLEGVPPSGLLRPPHRLLALEADGNRVLGAGKGNEGWVNIRTVGGEIANVSVFGATFYRTTLAITSGEDLVFGDTDAWSLSVHDWAGQLVRSIRMDAPPQPFTQDGIQEYLDTFTDDELTERRQREESLGAMELPETLPAFSELQADDQNRIWARTFTFSRTATQHWIVFDENGAVGTATMPAGFALRSVRADRLYGVFRDEFEVESVRVYEISAGM